MEQINREHEGFREKDFVRDVFGIDYFPREIENHVAERKPGWLDWRDVQEYFGLGSMAVDPYVLREGFMSERLYTALAGKIGKERLDKFFGESKSPKNISKDEQDVNDLAILLWGTPAEINKMRSRRGNREFFK